MVQVFLATELYLLLSSAILLSDKYGDVIPFLYNLNSYYQSKQSLKIAGIVLGIVLTICMALFPMDPGPKFLGDLLPEITVLITVMKSVAGANSGRKKFVGNLCLAVAVLHFLLPSFVIL